MNEDNRNLFPRDLMFGHAYVPNQRMRNIFTPEEALRRGSLFPELVSPYAPCQSMKVIQSLRETGGVFDGN